MPVGGLVGFAAGPAQPYTSEHVRAGRAPPGCPMSVPISSETATAPTCPGGRAGNGRCEKCAPHTTPAQNHLWCANTPCPGCKEVAV
jgi:hypothetical protein